MPDVRRYCFEHRARSRATLRSALFGPALLCLAVLSGCNTSKTLDVASTGSVEAPLAAADGGKVSAAKGKALAPVAGDEAGADDERVVTGSVAQPENKTAPPQKNAKAKTKLDKRTTGSTDRDVQLTPRCRYVLAMAGVDTALLRSPTLSAEANDEGDLGANISYDVLDLTRKFERKNCARPMPAKLRPIQADAIAGDILPGVDPGGLSCASQLS